VELTDLRLLVVSHKPCWPSSRSASGYATDGGFPFQMRALSELFASTTVAVPCAADGDRAGESALTGRNLTVRPLTPPAGRGLARKMAMLPWLVRNTGVLWREMRNADAVHAPIPGDVGTIGMLLAFAMRKPLFVRHCGNWLSPRTTAERFWKWFMQRAAGGRNVMLATGGHSEPPSPRNPALRWIFSTSLTADELRRYAVARTYPEDRCRLIIACRQDQRKGAGIVVDSLPLVLARMPHATLDVVGSGTVLPALIARAKALGVEDRVTFHGKVSHPTVIQLLQKADLFCYPTTASEGFPKVVLEAMACGLPVITTRVSVLPELLARGGGLLLDEAAPVALSEAIVRCLEAPSTYRAMSAAALDTAKHYSLERWRDAIGSSLADAWGRPEAEARG
jgi:glycosyl transferase family 1